MNIYYHIHHIVPRYMGGTDDPENLIKLSVKDHAEAHKDLYELHGNWQDYIAWKALSGQITMSEASRMAIKLGAPKHLKGKTYEEAYGDERALILKSKRAESNRRRTGIKYKSMNRKISNNDIKVSCVGCKKQTSVSAMGRHRKKCFN